MESRRLRLEERKYNLAKQNYQERSTLTLKRAKSSTKWTTRAATRKFEIGSFGGAYGLRVRDARRFLATKFFLNALAVLIFSVWDVFFREIRAWEG